MKKFLFTITFVAYTTISMAFNAKLDNIEIYKNKDGFNNCTGAYFATEVYTIDINPMQKMIARIEYPDKSTNEVVKIDYWREQTKKVAISYCLSEKMYNRNVNVTFIAPNGEKSNVIKIEQDFDIEKALPCESWPLQKALP